MKLEARTLRQQTAVRGTTHARARDRERERTQARNCVPEGLASSSSPRSCRTGSNFCAPRKQQAQQQVALSLTLRAQESPAGQILLACPLVVSSLEQFNLRLCRARETGQRAPASAQLARALFGPANGELRVLRLKLWAWVVDHLIRAEGERKRVKKGAQGTKSCGPLQYRFASIARSLNVQSARSTQSIQSRHFDAAATRRT